MDFAEIFEIPHDVLAEDRQFSLAVDLVEAGGTAVWNPGSRVLMQKASTDAVPWILVTLRKDEYGMEPVK